MRGMVPLALVSLLLAQDPAPAPALTHGPMLGAADEHSLEFWARASQPGEYSFELIRSDHSVLAPILCKAEPSGDLTLHWRVEGLEPGQIFGCRIRCGATELVNIDYAVFHTQPEGHGSASLVFGSCCDERAHPEQPVWSEISRLFPDALVLLGDTPYIDSTELEVRRRRYREFLAFEPLRPALSWRSFYATWDDHDYATNDRFGPIEGRASARQAFVEYHANSQLGQDGEGIFTSFRRGPVEVFLLDTRWFADSESSPLAPGKRSLLGSKQIAWLQRGLEASKAEFKVLACGMVWNGAVRPLKLDCWGNWLPERDGLLRWIGAKHISGLVLVGGDIHRSRVILHPTAALAGYDVPEFITSPLAQSVIEAAKVDLPGLLFDVGAPSAFLQVQAQRSESGAQFVGRIVDSSGAELFAKAFQLADLSPARGAAGATGR
jgi:alkaline phosphatase D